jgi:ParB/RepB/Spo0J family partition protein
MSDKGKKVVEKKFHALEKLRIEYVPITQIKPNDYNPNRQSEHDFNLLIKSITEDGFTQPIVVANDYTIVDGEHRWRAAAHLGFTEIPVVVVPMDPAQARIATLRHNRARGSEDIDLATEVLRDLERLGALDWAQDSLQLSDEELNRLLTDMPAPEALMAEEFNEAWVPDRDPANDAEPIANANSVVHSTPGAIEAVRRQEVRLAEAKSEEERISIRKDRRIFRVALSFSDDEADVVKEILGDQPAVNLLALCTAEQSRRA